MNFYFYFNNLLINSKFLGALWIWAFTGGNHCLGYDLSTLFSRQTIIRVWVPILSILPLPSFTFLLAPSSILITVTIIPLPSKNANNFNGVSFDNSIIDFFESYEWDVDLKILRLIFYKILYTTTHLTMQIVIFFKIKKNNIFLKIKEQSFNVPMLHIFSLPMDNNLKNNFLVV